jgi:hypothetical protein
MPIAIPVSPVRRLFAVAVLLALALVLGALGLGPGLPLAGAALLLALGAGAALVAARIALATGGGLVLTADGLCDGSDRVIARWEEIAGIGRGPFAMKPARGFALCLRAPGPVAWVPGLWWRVGRRLGVGGLTDARATRAAAEAIALRLAARRPPP